VSAVWGSQLIYPCTSNLILLLHAGMLVFACCDQVCEEPNAMAIASCSSDGQPSLRYVLLKGEVVFRRVCSERLQLAPRTPWCCWIE
jgi:pyridoxine/pyridoxamine 5'-phosphate oxidase